MSFIKNVVGMVKPSSKKAAVRALKRAKKRTSVSNAKITSEIKNGHKHATLSYTDATGARQANSYMDGRNIGHSYSYDLPTGGTTTHTLDHSTGINSSVSTYKGRVTSEGAAGPGIKNYNNSYSSTGTTVKRTDKAVSGEGGQVREFYAPNGEKIAMQVDNWGGSGDLMQITKNKNGSKTILKAENGNAISKMDDTGNMEGIKAYYTTLPKDHYVNALRKKFANQSAAKTYSK